MAFRKVIRKEFLEISPYRLDDDFPTDNLTNLVRMSLNENPLVEKVELTKILEAALRKIDPREYPRPHGGHAVQAIARFHDMEPSRLFLGNGIDDVLDRLVRVLVDKGSKVVVAEPTFFMYTYYTQLCQGQKVEVMLKPDFSLDTDSLIEASRDSQLVFICSPNNPTGNHFEKSDLEDLLDRCHSVVAVDETYVEFGKYSILEWTSKYRNLVVLRSFSKAFGLAGIRTGYLIADQELVEAMKKTVHPFNVSSLAQQAVVEVLQRYDYFKKIFEDVKKEREWLLSQLRQIRGVTPYPSDANFILFKVDHEKSSSRIQSELRGKGILIKDRGKVPLLQNCLRVTVGTRPSNKRFLEELGRILD